MKRWFKVGGYTFAVALILFCILGIDLVLQNHVSKLQPLFAKTDHWSEEPLKEQYDFAAQLRQFKQSVRLSLLGLSIGLAVLCGLLLWQLQQNHRTQLALKKINAELQKKIQAADDLTHKLSQQASYDELTGLANRREFEQRLELVIKQTKREPTEHALCFLDLDSLKQINDACGYRAGDELLRQVASVFSQQVRKYDTVARLAGDEFAILLEHCTVNNAARVAEKLRNSVAQHRFSWGEHFFNITVTIGIVPINQHSHNKNELLNLADSACSAAKQQGHNQTHLYQPPETIISTKLATEAV